MVLALTSLSLLTFSAIAIPMPIRPFLTVAAVVYALGVGSTFLAPRPNGGKGGSTSPARAQTPDGTPAGTRD